MLNFGIQEAMVASKVLNSKFDHCRRRILNFGIKEVLVVKNLDFADWPFPESAAAKLKKSQIWFRGLGIIITASAKYKNAKN